MQAMTIDQALDTIGSLPKGRKALQFLIDNNGWFIEDPKIIEFLKGNDEVHGDTGIRDGDRKGDEP